MRPSSVALIDGDRQVSYEELDRESDRIAACLQRDGVGKGTRVAILDHDSARLFAVVFGIAKAGAVIVGSDLPDERIQSMADALEHGESLLVVSVRDDALIGPARAIVERRGGELVAAL